MNNISDNALLRIRRTRYNIHCNGISTMIFLNNTINFMGLDDKIRYTSFTSEFISDLLLRDNHHIKVYEQLIQNVRDSSFIRPDGNISHDSYIFDTDGRILKCGGWYFTYIPDSFIIESCYHNDCYITIVLDTDGSVIKHNDVKCFYSYINGTKRLVACSESEKLETYYYDELSVLRTITCLTKKMKKSDVKYEYQ